MSNSSRLYHGAVDSRPAPVVGGVQEICWQGASWWSCSVHCSIQETEEQKGRWTEVWRRGTCHCVCVCGGGGGGLVCMCVCCVYINCVDCLVCMMSIYLLPGEASCCRQVSVLDSDWLYCTWYYWTREGSHFRQVAAFYTAMIQGWVVMYFSSVVPSLCRLSTT